MRPTRQLSLAGCLCGLRKQQVMELVLLLVLLLFSSWRAVQGLRNAWWTAHVACELCCSSAVNDAYCGFSSENPALQSICST
jgi:hypothetical protein